jgi:hypothetical protein
MKSYKDYQGRTWKVKENEPSAKCTEGQVVTFRGSARQVIIDCDGKNPYGKSGGEYKRESNTIERADYTISMLESLPPTIAFTMVGTGSEGGSWIAEDNIFEPDDDQP